MTDEEQKDFRNLLRESWLGSIMERDKSIFTVASGGIGLLFAFIQESKIRTQFEMCVYLIALAGFLAAVIASVLVFKENRDYFQALLLKTERNDKILSFLDKLMIGGFFIGIAFSTIFVGLKTIESYTENQKNENPAMNDNNRKPTQNPRERLDESAKGFDRLAPPTGQEKINASAIGFDKMTPSGGQAGGSSSSGAAGGADGKKEGS